MGAIDSMRFVEQQMKRKPFREKPTNVSAKSFLFEHKKKAKLRFPVRFYLGLRSEKNILPNVNIAESWDKNESFTFTAEALYHLADLKVFRVNFCK